MPTTIAPSTASTRGSVPPTRAARALITLAKRRAALTAGNPRQIAVPLLTPVLFATVIAPALEAALGDLHSRVDYTAFVSVGAVGLLVPLAATLAGLSVIVDRTSGAQRELLAAPISRALLVLGNLAVVLGLCAFQIAALIGVAVLRGARFHASAAGVAWFLAAALLFTVLMYALAEILASRISNQEEYGGVIPVVAILPWFFAGALFPIAALPGGLTAFAKFLPITHALALMRYGLIDPRATGLHDIWGMTNTTAEAWLSLGVVALSAALLIALAIRVFTRSAVQ